MKAYTSIEQSKKLAEILPLESADMHYNNGSCRGVDYTEHFSAELMPYQEALYLMKTHKTNFMFQVIPCWSLAALLDYLSANFRVDIKYLDNYWEVDCIVHVEYSKELIDACVEMILQLHELKLL